MGNKVTQNKTLLDNLANRDKNVIQKIIDWVRNAVSKLGETAEERAMRKDLKKLEKMVVEALEAGTGGVSLEEVEKRARKAENVQSVKFGENKNADSKLATARASIKRSTGIRFSLPINDYPYNMQTAIKEYIDAVDPKLKRWSAIIGKMAQLILSGII